MRHDEHMVIGFFAYRSRSEVVCTEPDACVITGSEEAMKRYIEEVDPRNVEKMTIRKTRFGEIVQGLQAGGAYGFDEEAYSRFLPLARDLGIPVADANFEGGFSEGRRFFTVRLLSA